jgi:hypothetical protein
MEANRETIAQVFKTDSLTTHRILHNLCFGFFATHFQEPEEAWALAHIHKGKLSFHLGVSIEWLKDNFELFASMQLCHHEPVWDAKLRCWSHPSSYVKVEPMFLEEILF